jgi:hypothetical protein
MVRPERPLRFARMLSACLGPWHDEPVARGPGPLSRRNRATFPSHTRPWPLVNREADVFQVGGAVKKHPEYSEHAYFLAVETAFKNWEDMQNVGR